MKGSVIASMFVGLALDQTPPLFGCVCEGAAGGSVPCSTVLNPILYTLEPSCYNDKWVRYFITAGVMLLAGCASTYMQQKVEKFNCAVVAANLCNEVPDPL